MGSRKRVFFILLLIFFVSLCGKMPVVSGQESEEIPVDLPVLPYGEDNVSLDMMLLLIKNLEDIFPITSELETFAQTKPAVFSEITPDMIVRALSENDKRELALFANADGIHDRLAADPMKLEYPSNFQLTADVMVTDVFPNDRGGCYVGFTNDDILGKTDNDDEQTILLLLTGQYIELYVRKNGDDSGIGYYVAKSENTNVRLSIIHLMEHTYLFVDDVLMGEFPDGASGPFQLMYGPMVFADGDTAACSFDNITVRKVTNQ